MKMGFLIYWRICVECERLVSRRDPSNLMNLDCVGLDDGFVFSC